MSASTKPKIFIIVTARYPVDVCGAALAEDGTSLAGHLSSNEDWLRHDMGLTGKLKHEKYNEHYPDGWELVDLIDCPDLSNVVEYMVALGKNRALAKAEGEHPPVRER